MLDVITVEQAWGILINRFGGDTAPKRIPLEECWNKVSGETVSATGYVPDFNRSMVDGYAVKAADTFGAGEAIPALLRVSEAVEMGCLPERMLAQKECCAVPTGGAVPEGADAVVMVEDTQMLPDGTLCIYKPAAPGNHMVYRGDDIKPGDSLLVKGERIGARQIGALAAMGIDSVTVEAGLSVGVISTGNELIAHSQKATPGKIRDINGPMLSAALNEMGIHVVSYGIIPDEGEVLEATVGRAVSECDAVILSGGTSVGEKDEAERILSHLGSLLWHGLAVKPGKPTLAAEIEKKPVIALPGHPMAAYFMWTVLVRPLFAKWLGQEVVDTVCRCRIRERVSSNNGREALVPVAVSDGEAEPIRGKSGLITILLRADGYIRIARDCEGLEAGEPVDVIMF